MGCVPKSMLWFAAIGLTACASDKNRMAFDSETPSGDAAVFQDPYPFSENQEAQMGFQAYDQQTRELNEENSARR